MEKDAVEHKGRNYQLKYQENCSIWVVRAGRNNFLIKGKLTISDPISVSSDHRSEIRIGRIREVIRTIIVAQDDISKSPVSIFDV